MICLEERIHTVESEEVKLFAGAHVVKERWGYRTMTAEGGDDKEKDVRYVGGGQSSILAMILNTEGERP